MGNTKEPTYRELTILKVMLEDPNEEHAGADLMRLTKIPSGSLYVILGNLQAEGILDSRWEEIDPREAGRPRRRYYKLTAEGVRTAQRALASLVVPARMLRPEWGL